MSSGTMETIHFVATRIIAPLAGTVLGIYGGPITGLLASITTQLQSDLIMREWYNPPGPKQKDGPSTNPISPPEATYLAPGTDYGNPIQRIFGVVSVNTNLLAVKQKGIYDDSVLVWNDFEGRVRISKKRKVGGSYILAKMETPIYTFAVMVGGPITAVHRIWFNGAIVYDRRVFGDARVQYRTTSAYFTVYLGTDDQMPDPDLGSDVAYRGRSYVVFHNVSLKEFNDRIPDVRVEVSGQDVGIQAFNSTDYYSGYMSFQELRAVYTNKDKTGTRQTVDSYTIEYDNNGDTVILDNQGEEVDPDALGEVMPWSILPLPGRLDTDYDGTVYERSRNAKYAMSIPKLIWRYYDRSGNNLSQERYWLPGPDEIPGRFYGSGFNIHKENKRQYYGDLFEQVDTWFMRDQLTNKDMISVDDNVQGFVVGNKAVVDFKKDNTVPRGAEYPYYADIQPVNLWAIGDRIPLSLVLSHILEQCGFSKDEYDVSEFATLEIPGFVLSRYETAIETLAKLSRAYFFTVSETDGKLRIRPEAQPIWNIDHRNCMINEDGLVVNSLHDVAGRDGYFSSSSGTSEGQFTLCLAAAKAYQATGEGGWLDYAVRLGEASLTLYAANPGSGSVWAPHWLFNVKRPIKLDSAFMYANFGFDGSGSLSIPHGAPFYGENVKDVTKLSSGWGVYLWRNVFADMVYTGYVPTLSVFWGRGHGDWWYWGREEVPPPDPPPDPPPPTTYQWEANPSGHGKWTYSYSFTYHTYEGMGVVTPPAHPLQAPTITDRPMTLEITSVDISTGTVSYNIPADYSHNGRVAVTYIMSEIGEYLDVGEMYEAWPFWRRMKEGEVAGAGDSLYWAHDAYSALFSITGESRWSDCKSANENTLLSVSNLDDGRLWMFEFPGVKEAFVDNSMFFRSDRDGVTIKNVSRDEFSGRVVLAVPRGTGEVQIGRGFYDDNTITEIYWEVELVDGDPQRLSDFIYDSGKGVQKTGGTLAFDDRQTFDPRHRYIYDLTHHLRNGETSGTVSVKAFRTLLWAGDPNLQWTGDPIYSLMVSVWGTDTPVKLKIGTIRPYPEAPMQYVPGAPVFTVNTFLNNKVPWSGAPGIGYAYPHVWHSMGATTEFNNTVQFLDDAATQYTARTGETGWMVPAYYWPRFDNLEYGTPGTWGWKWVDPNSQWGGYFYRNLYSMAKSAHVSNILKNRAYERIERIDTDWPGWPQFPITDVKGETLDVWAPNTKFVWGGYNGNSNIIRPTIVNGFVYKPLATGTSGSLEPVWPTTIGATVNDGGITWECTGYQYGVGAYGNYHEPHFCALILRACYYLETGGAILTPAQLAVVDSAAQKCWAYLRDLYRDDASPFDGSWADPANNNWWAFWHGEIVLTLAEIKSGGWSKPWLNLSEVDYQLNGSLDFWKRWDRKYA